MNSPEKKHLNLLLRVFVYYTSVIISVLSNIVMLPAKTELALICREDYKTMQEVEDIFK